MLRMTEQEYQALMSRRKGNSTGKGSSNKTGPPKSCKPRKYRNVKVYVFEDGYAATEKLEGHGKIAERFDSVKEYHRCQELRTLERAHRISNLQLQTPFLLAPAFTDKEGKKHRASIYRADFTYEEAGQEVVEDVKAYSQTQGKYLCTETFHLKWKLLHRLYPDKTFRLY